MPTGYPLDSAVSKYERVVHGCNLVYKNLQLNRKLAWIMAELGIEVCLCGNTEPT
jgi:phosphomannomutase